MGYKMPKKSLGPWISSTLLLIIILQSFSCQDIKISKSTITRQEFERFEGLDKIKTLVLSNSGIERINEDAFDDFPALECLNLNNNSITEINFGLKQLRFLDLSSNLLTKPPNLKKFPKLLNLNLDENKIYDISFKTTHPLESLNLSNNPLKDVHINLEKLSDLKIINSNRSYVKLNINCPNLISLETHNVLVNEYDLDKICKISKNATIYKNTDVVDCSSTVEEELNISKNEDVSEDCFEETTFINNDEPLNYVETRIVEERASPDDQRFQTDKLVMIYLLLMVIIFLLVFVLLVTTVFLICKIRKPTSLNMTYGQNIYSEIEQGSKYLTPNPVNNLYLKPFEN